MNDYFTVTSDVIPFSTAQDTDIDVPLAQIEAAFDKFPDPHDSKPGFKTVPISDATALDEAVSASQVVTGSLRYSADSGAANAYVVSLAIAPASYYVGMVVWFKATSANTGASTLNVNALGVKTLKRYDGSDLLAGDITDGQIVCATWTGAYFQITSALHGDGVASAASAAASAASAAASESSATASAASAVTSGQYADMLASPFDSVADMTSASVVVGRIYSTKGNKTPGDGGAAKYLCIAGNSGDGYCSHNVGANTLKLQVEDKINVRACGANLVDDATAAIQAAIVFAESLFLLTVGRAPVYFPAGGYKISSPLRIRSNYITLVGDGRLVSTIRQQSRSANGINLYADGWEGDVRVSDVNIRNLGIVMEVSGLAPIESGIGIHDIRSDRTILDNVRVHNFPQGIKREGSLNSTNLDVRISTDGTTAKATVETDTYCLCHTTAELTAGATYGYVHTYRNLSISGGYNGVEANAPYKSLIVIEDNDVINFNGGYWGPYLKAVELRKKAGAVSNNIYSTEFTNIYFEGLGLACKAFYCNTDSTVNINSLSVLDCFMNTMTNAMDMTAQSAKHWFIRTKGGWQTQTAFKFDGIDDIDFNGKIWSLTGSTGVDFTNCNGVTAKAEFKDCGSATYGVKISAGCSNVNITSVVDDGSVPEPVNINSATTGIYGTGIPVPYTPELTFGGANVGLTYSSRAGSYLVKNGVAHINARILLSSKGSSVGTAQVSMPTQLIPPAIVDAHLSLAMEAWASGTITKALLARALTTGNLITLKQVGTAGNANLTDANFTDSSEIYVSGAYPII